MYLSYKQAPLSQLEGNSTLTSSILKWLSNHYILCRLKLSRKRKAPISITSIRIGTYVTCSNTDKLIKSLQYISEKVLYRCKMCFDICSNMFLQRFFTQAMYIQKLIHMPWILIIGLCLNDLMHFKQIREVMETGEQMILDIVGTFKYRVIPPSLVSWEMW